jgi:hypothetical protein
VEVLAANGRVIHFAGVKYTTALSAGRRLLDRLFPGKALRGRLSHDDPDRPPRRTIPSHEEVVSAANESPAKGWALVKGLWREESVLSLDDLVMRRTDWGTDPRLGSVMSKVLETALPPDASAVT